MCCYYKERVYVWEGTEYNMRIKYNRIHMTPLDVIDNRKMLIYNFSQGVPHILEYIPGEFLGHYFS